MKNLAILSSALVLIFACSSRVSLQAGQWEMTPKITDLQSAGVAPATAERLKEGMASQMPPFPTCISAATAADPANFVIEVGAGGFGVAQFTAEPAGSGSGTQQACNFTRRTFEGGRIDMAATCPTATGVTQMTYAGSYTATTLEMRISTDAQAAGQPGLRATVAVSGRRTGDCSG
jgi:hypothetical protein